MLAVLAMAVLWLVTELLVVATGVRLSGEGATVGANLQGLFFLNALGAVDAELVVVVVVQNVGEFIGGLDADHGCFQGVTAIGGAVGVEAGVGRVGGCVVGEARVGMGRGGCASGGDGVEGGHERHGAARGERVLHVVGGAKIGRGGNVGERRLAGAGKWGCGCGHGG